MREGKASYAWREFKASVPAFGEEQPRRFLTCRVGFAGVSLFSGERQPPVYGTSTRAAGRRKDAPHSCNQKPVPNLEEVRACSGAPAPNDQT